MPQYPDRQPLENTAAIWAEKLRTEIGRIESQAMHDQLGWPEFLAGLSEAGRDSMMHALLDKRTYERRYVLKITLREVERVLN
jgi:hypothetical protein